MFYTRFQLGINNMCSKPLKHFKITLLLFFQSFHNMFYLDTRNLSIDCQSIKRVALHCRMACTQQTKHTLVTKMTMSRTSPPHTHPGYVQKNLHFIFILNYGIGSVSKKNLTLYHSIL